MSIFRFFLLYLLMFMFLNANDKISVQLNWRHQFQFAGYYMALEKGYYKKEGLEVELKEYQLNQNITQDVIDLKSTYGVGKSSTVLDALQGKPISLISAIYQTSPLVLIATNPNIKRIIDLKNKNINLNYDIKSIAGINFMFKSQGLGFDDFNQTRYNIDVKKDDIEQKIDAMVGFIANETYILKKRNINYTIFKPSNYGVNFYGGILFTSKQELQKHPARVDKFKHATLKGWEYAFNNIDETAKLIYKKYNTQNKSLGALKYEGEVLKNLSGIDNNMLGHINYNKIEGLKKLYLLLSFNLNPMIDVSSFIYNDNLESLAKSEKEYLKNNTIYLLTNHTFPPLSYKDKNHKSAGIEIEYWQLINKILKNSKYKIKEVASSKDAIKLLKKNKNYLRYSFSKLDDNNFITKSNTLFSIPIAIATLSDKPYIPDISKLKNVKIGIYKQLSYYEMLKEKYKNLDFVPVKNTDDAIKKTQSGKIFGFVEKIPVISYKINKLQQKNIKISATFNEKYDAKLSINSSNKTLISIINKAISMMNDVDKNSIDSKYYFIIYDKTINYKWLYSILLPLVLILLVVLLINQKLYREIKRRKELEKELTNLAQLDGLTGCFNRRKMDDIFRQEISRAKRYNKDLSIIFFDIDNFKTINDILGHEVGDKVLVNISKLVLKNIREIDYLGRWGGEEFIIILPETNKQKTWQVAKSIKNKISTHNFDINRNVTCSFGISQFETNDTKESLVKKADSAMYYVKKHGKNSVKAG